MNCASDGRDELHSSLGQAVFLREKVESFKVGTCVVKQIDLIYVRIFLWCCLRDGIVTLIRYTYSL